MSILSHFLFRLPAAAVPLQEEAGNPFDWGLSPLVMVLIFVLVVIVLWLALRSESGRTGLHAAPHSDDLGHEETHAEGHAGQEVAESMEAAEEVSPAEPSGSAEDMPEEPAAGEESAPEEVEPDAAEDLT